MRIDSHLHLWRYAPDEFEWISDSMAALRRDFLPQELDTLCADAGVEGVIAVQARQSMHETRWLLELADTSPILGVVGWARRPNVCKVSGLVTEADPAAWIPTQSRRYFDIALECFGPNRLMIGTEWPGCTAGCSYTQWWALAADWTASLSVAEGAAILSETATRVNRMQSVAAFARQAGEPREISR
jgi:predicted TIM-barrel fold metal-dependent hydrolase